MIEDSWDRICGVQMCPNGEVAAVWLAHDAESDVVHVYDACIFKREVLVVIAEGIAARGRQIPIAWSKSDEEFIEKLLDRGCDTLPDPADDSDSMADLLSRDILERMRTHRFKVEKRLSEWLDELKNFQREDQKVPRETFPLMAATRHAIDQLTWAKSASATRASKINYPKVAVY